MEEKKVTYEQKRDDAGEKKKRWPTRGKNGLEKCFCLNIKLISIILDRDRDLETIYMTRVVHIDGLIFS